jgi:hypothetical protein
VELQVLDPWLRHRIAAALQRAGVGSVDGAIELTIRQGRGEDGSPTGTRLIELDAESRTDEPLLAADPDRALGMIQALAQLAPVARAANRLQGGVGLFAICGDSSLFAAAVARRASGPDREIALLDGRSIDAATLRRALEESDEVFVGDVERAPAAVQSELAALANGARRRVVVSVASNLSDATEQGGLQRDLAQALERCALVVDPIRKRRDDLDAVVGALLAHACTQLDRPRVPELTSEASAALHAHHWPGGVDEVAAALERAALLSDGERIQLADLPPSVAAGVSTDSPFLPEDWAERNLRDVRESAASAAEHAYLDAVLRHTRGVIKDAAAMCGIGPRSLYDRMQQHGLRKEDYKH